LVVVAGGLLGGAAGTFAACTTTRPPTWDELSAANERALSTSGDATSAADPTGATTTGSTTTGATTTGSTTTGSTTTAATRATTPSARTAAASSGVLIDRALVDLNAARARARPLGRTTPLWSEAWIDALLRIDDALTQPPLASDLGAFVRARITLEVELQNDETRGVLLPGDLRARVDRTLRGVDESVTELRAANAPGTVLTLRPRPGDGELILHAPVAPLVVNSPFGRRADPFTGAVRYHAGVDLDAPEGASVYASAGAVVVYAGPQGGYGRYIVLDHGDGVRTHYAHLSAIHVAVGAVVDEGDVIGAVGSSGRSTGPHLHFAVTDELGAFLDPMALLDIPFSSLRDQVARREAR
jgi:murein DD-endopeptidase MepM/ murein hydrolase activator NlpD